MIDTHAEHPLNALEQRLATLVDGLREGCLREQRLVSQLNAATRHSESLEQQLAEQHEQLAMVVRERGSLESRIGELEAELAQLRHQRQQLAEHNSELVEENRELDEQNRELEAHNTRLRERAQPPQDSSSATAIFARPTRRAQGLAALIHHRPRDHTVDPPQGVDGAGSMPEDTEAALQRGLEHEMQQSDLPFDKAPSPQSLLTDWYRKYDQTFFKGHTRPLKIGIHEDLAAREPWPEKLVRRALACYVNLPRYLKSVREGTGRIDLDGQTDGQVDAQAAEHARRKLDRLQAERQRGRQQPRHRAAGGGAEVKAQAQAMTSTREPGTSKPTSTSTAPAPDSTQAPDARTSCAQTSCIQPPYAQAPGTGRDAKASSSSEFAALDAEHREPRSDESREVRLQRKLDALMARHNSH